MPKDNSIKSVLIIGSGPIIIGQACEFDYSGSQAARSLREEGIKVILINSNPATIMTDPMMADKVYLLPLNVESIEQILEETKPAAPVAAPVKAAPVVAGVAVIQLASLPDEAKARDLMKTLQAKYASILAGAVLHVAQADLGARGVYFRIQSQGLSETEASRVCSALKQQNAGCILVRK